MTSNSGFAQAIDVIVPSGTLLNPRYPAAVGGRASLMMALSNMVYRAIAKALPGKLGGVGEGADMLHFNSHTEGKFQSFMDVFFGGWGGRPHVDGIDVSVFRYPAEVSEAAILMASRLWKRKDTPYGGTAGARRFGSLEAMPGIDADVEALLAPLRRLPLSVVA